MNGNPVTIKYLFRRLAHGGWRCFLRSRSRSWQPSSGRRYIVIAPHPDDETLGCGGLIAASRSQGATVDVVFLTDGNASLPGHPILAPRQLADLRAREARTALAILGVAPEHVHCLGAPDGRLAHLDAADRSALAGRLGALFRQLQPDETFLPWRRDGSSEHEAAFPIAIEARQSSGCASSLLEYPVWAWWSPRLLATFAMSGGRMRRLSIRTAADRKRRALEEYRSQIRPLPPWTEAALPAGFPRFFLGSSEYFVSSLP
jgi:LmbE family N-acetylglucosaminyl deacetylase